MRRALLLAAVALAGCLGAARDEPTPPPPPDAALERTFAVRVVQARDGGVGEVRAFNCVLASGDAVVKGGEVTATWTAATPLAERLELEWDPRDGSPPLRAVGPSPLALAGLSGRVDGPEPARLWLGLPRDARGEIDQDVTVHVRVRYAGELDPEPAACA